MPRLTAGSSSGTFCARTSSIRDASSDDHDEKVDRDGKPILLSYMLCDATKQHEYSITEDKDVWQPDSLHRVNGRQSTPKRPNAF
jgi:hypothetical protein